MAIRRAADALLAGGVVTCPTEGVYGLSCMPDDPAAILRLLRLKARDPAKGLILIASERAQLEPWMAVPGTALPDPDGNKPVTWLVPAAEGTSPLVRGLHPTLAVRLTANPVARALCDAVDSALISTSANRAGETTVRNAYVLRRKFAACVDYIVPGACGPASGASEIRDLKSGKVIRSSPA